MAQLQEIGHTLLQRQPRWLIAYTRVNQEKKVAAMLRRMGIDSFVPVREEVHQWSDRRKRVEVVLIRSRIFIHTSESQKVQILQNIPFVSCFMKDGRDPSVSAVVPDEQMAAFIRLCETHNETLRICEMSEGDRVRVVSGPMAGMEGIVTQSGRGHDFSIRIENIGYAVVTVDSLNLEKIPDAPSEE